MADDNLEPLASIADLAVKTGASTDDEKLKLALVWPPVVSVSRPIIRSAW